MLQFVAQMLLDQISHFVEEQPYRVQIVRPRSVDGRFRDPVVAMQKLESAVVRETSTRFVIS